MKAPVILAACLFLTASLAGCKVTQESTTAPDGSGSASEINVDFDEEFKQDVNNAINSTAQEFDNSMSKIDAELQRLGDKARNTELQLKIKQFNEEKELINVRYQRMDKSRDNDDNEPEPSSRVKEEWAEVRHDMKNLWQAIREEADENTDANNRS